MLALIGFALMIVLMFVLIKEKMAPPLAFILLPIIAAVLAGFGVADEYSNSVHFFHFLFYADVRCGTV